MTCPVCAGVAVRAVRIPSRRALVRCADCRLLFDRAPAAVEMERASLTDDEWRLEERVAARRAPHFARVLRVVRPPGRLLDVGTGVGRMLTLAREAGWQATGVDIDPAVVAYARARGLDVRCGALPTLGLPAASFDLVTLWNVLDFVADPLALLAECRRVLAPGGRLFVRTPNTPVQRAAVGLAWTLSALGVGRPAAGCPRWFGVIHTSNFHARTLRVALVRAGFLDIRVENSPPVGGDPYLGLGGPREQALDLGKRVVFGAARAVALASGGRLLLGSSLEAWARRPA
jgi:SAM-dependent methyltransferase